MRTPTRHVARDGTETWKVKYRSAGVYTSQTFRRRPDALTFAALLASGPNGVAEALAWLAARERQDAAATFGEFFETYVDQLTGVTVRTRADYRAQKRRYLSHLDPLPLPLLTRAHVSEVVNTLEAEGKSRKTIKNVIHMLSSCLALAVEEGLIPRNPCRRVRLPAASVDSDEARFLTPAEFAALHDATPAHYQPLILALGGTGMRWSEATALQGQHLVGNVLTIRQAWKRVPGGWEIGVPKSAKSKRTVVLPATLVDVLAELHPKRGEFLFRTPQGHPIRHSNFRHRVWAPACDAAGLHPTPGIHALRHSHIAWMIAGGVPLPVIQRRVGHEKIGTTIDTYGHLLPDLQAAASQAAEIALPAARTAPRSPERLH